MGRVAGLCMLSRPPPPPSVFTCVRPKVTRLLPLTPPAHPPLAAPHPRLHVAHFTPQGVVLSGALLALALHLGAQCRVAVVHKPADLGHCRIGQDLHNGGDLRLEADAPIVHCRCWGRSSVCACTDRCAWRLLLRLPGVNGRLHDGALMQTSRGQCRGVRVLWSPDPYINKHCQLLWLCRQLKVAL